VVRLLRLPVDEALRGRAQVLAKDLMGLRDPGLVPVRSVHEAYDGIALVLDPPSPSHPLHLLARERLLSAGETVTLGVALAWALAAAHDAGVAHGRLRDADLLLDAQGRPVLGGVGVRGVLGAAGEPADDVRALSRMLASLLDRESPEADRVQSALSEQPGTASELAVRLASSAAATPIRVAAIEPEPSPRARPWGAGLLAGLFGPKRHSRPRRGLLAVATGLAIFVAFGLAGWAFAPAPAEHGAAAPPNAAGPPEPDWRAVLERLDSARAAAFARPGANPIAAADAPKSAAYRYDAAAVAALRGRHAHATGLRMVLERIDVQSLSARRVTLTVTDRLPSYRIEDTGARLITQVASRGPRAHLVALRDVGAASSPSWRIETVSELPTS
jgi:hypothetical protein